MGQLKDSGLSTVRWRRSAGPPGDPFPARQQRLRLRGKTIRKGESVCLFYASGNRDEEVFAEPDAFHVDRDPNPHIGFGMGEHVCLGAHLARLELRHAFAQLRERLVRCEPNGVVERVRSSFVGGIKRAPMRWEIRPAASV
jgi:cytochrome P450